MTQWLDRGLVQSPLAFGLCLSEKDFKKELKRLHVPKSTWPAFTVNNSHATTHFFENKADGICAIITLDTKIKVKPIQVCSLLVHEAVHLWQEIRKMLGEKEPSPEFEAYSVQWLSQELMFSYESQMSKMSKITKKKAPQK